MLNDNPKIAATDAEQHVKGWDGALAAVERAIDERILSYERIAELAQRVPMDGVYKAREPENAVADPSQSDAVLLGLQVARTIVENFKLGES